MADDVNPYSGDIASPGYNLITGIRRINWGAIWTGVVVALGMMFMLKLFGLFVGFRMYNPDAAKPWAGLMGWTGVWYLVTAAFSMYVGGWCAARSSGSWRGGDGILHGLATWGLTTVAAMTVATLALWAVIREGITVMAAAMTTLEPAGPGTGTSRVPPGAMNQLQAHAGPISQAMAHTISNFSLLIFCSLALGLLFAVLGGWIGRSPRITATPAEVVPGPTRRAA
jgi:hypothetical protein